VRGFFGGFEGVLRGFGGFSGFFGVFRGFSKQKLEKKDELSQTVWMMMYKVIEDDISSVTMKVYQDCTIASVYD